MPFLKHIVAIGMVAGCLLAGAMTVRAADDPKIERGRALLKLWLDGKYQDFVGAADEAVKANFTPEQAAQARQRIVLQVGAYQAEESAEVKSAGGYDSVRFVLRCANGTVKLRVVLDSQGRMSGFWIDGIDADQPYEAPPYVDAKAYREEKVTVGTGEFALPGILAIPDGKGPFPGVVLVHGSGPHDADETIFKQRPFRDLAGGLATRGIAVLRYVKRTKAFPLSKKADEWSVQNETIGDAVLGAELLRKRPEIDARRVYVAGHSQGGMAAPYIAQQDGQLAGLIILAGSARPVGDILMDQYTYLAKLDGTVSPGEQANIDKLKQTLEAIRTGKLADAPADPPFPVHAIVDYGKYDPAPLAAKSDLPILIVQGGRDYQVTKADYAIWQKHLAGRPKVTFKLFDDLNHVFNTGKGPSSPDEYMRVGHVDPRVVDLVATWIGGPTLRPAPKP